MSSKKYVITNLYIMKYNLRILKLHNIMSPNPNIYLSIDIMQNIKGKLLIILIRCAGSIWLGVQVWISRIEENL